MSDDLFEQINNAVLDLQSAELQTYHQPLRTLARLLRDERFSALNAELTDGLDLDAFLETQRPRGGMVGSDRIEWPDDPKKALGLTLLMILRFADNPDWMTTIGHRYYYSGQKIIGSIRTITSQLIIPFARDYKALALRSRKPIPKSPSAYSNRIFIVHGRDEAARESTARYLERLGFEAVILHEQANRGRTIVEKIEANSDVGFAVILMTPDDEGRIQGGELEPRARQNVLLELGYFMGVLGRDRLCVLKKGQVEIPSDFAGVVWEPMDDNGAWKQSLAKELRAAGYTIDWNKVME